MLSPFSEQMPDFAGRYVLKRRKPEGETHEA